MSFVWFDLTCITRYVHCIPLYYAYHEISLKPGKMSKFQPIHSTIQIWIDFHENEANSFFFEKNSKWLIFQNGHFSKSSILEIFLRKFHRSFLGLVRLIDLEAINVAQLIWF